MIKFIRNLRKDLFSDNMVSGGSTSSKSKYFKYAIGEIFLVVIGILIAVQVNNWNENRIEKKKERTYLQNIRRDLTRQLESIQLQLNYEKRITEAASPIIENYQKNKDFQVDSLFTAKIGILTGRMTFVKTDPTYTELISTGNIDLVRNDGIKGNIIKYYQNIERLERIINNNNNLYTDAVFIPLVLEITEVQLSGQFKMVDVFGINNRDLGNTIVNLNEHELKEITVAQLTNPENKLKFINGVNFRNLIANIHISMLESQKGQTEILLQEIENQ